MKSQYRDKFENPEALKLIEWARGLNDRIKAARLVKIADRMERRYREYYISILM